MCERHQQFDTGCRGRDRASTAKIMFGHLKMGPERPRTQKTHAPCTHHMTHQETGRGNIQVREGNYSVQEPHPRYPQARFVTRLASTGHTWHLSGITPDDTPRPLQNYVSQRLCAPWMSSVLGWIVCPNLRIASMDKVISKHLQRLTYLSP